ncbi:MAG: peptidoglycan editing factor PgeF [Burkholderiaceae bacterium]|nr:peptidoglycan editing factor PgeF [Burkholderiaceae bacterium]MCD8517504.1 peptidoglycan editing factor PgeF [Burkholderiaceae bacterium]MCD8537888.1 peptidoglycan editing factor PgeF [Burkholderiaceae bacterium]MCD8565916.1 peptidoglycan editing factor PgeF [Burkholderiaceae bacterium]
MHNAWIRIENVSPKVQGFCTTRHHGVGSKPFDSLNLGDHVGDDPACVQANRERLAQWLPAPPVWVEQVHGTNVLVLSGPVRDRLIQADAIVTNRSAQVLGILTADCMPVVLANDEGTVLGLAHAGWRGLANGVLQQTLIAMHDQVRELGTWRAWIGPCISARAFQVGDEVRRAFMAVDPALAACFTPDVAPHKWLCDLPSIAKSILLAAGARSVAWCGHCTVSDPANRFFSYRRDGQTGRMATVAWLD